MHVICKGCGEKIPVSHRPEGMTHLDGVRAEGVSIDGGSIGFHEGGSIAFGPKGSIGFGPPAASDFACPACRKTHQYAASEILDD